MSLVADDLPPRLGQIVEEFATAPPRDRLELLLEYAQSLPALPERLSAHPERMERVPECQSPLFAVAETDERGEVHLFFDAPAESPTTRGFAGIFHAGLDGESAAAILAIPGDVIRRLALADVISPLRLRGATALLARVQRQVRHELARADLNAG
jgi:cysteine desulfuration protein SufE